jgi:phosphate transport system permease protein
MSDKFAKRKQKFFDFVVSSTITLLSLLTISPLILIIGYISYKGFNSFSINLITKNPVPMGEVGGGIFNGIIGSVIIILIASIVGVPLGILCGLYLVESKRGKLRHIIRLFVEILQGIPSIVIGIIGYIIIVMPMQRFSALAGGLTLAIIMIPIIVITTEEVLRLIPVELREAGIALGMTQWRVTLFIVLRTGIGGLTSGILLSLSRIAGETAPLLFTVLGSQFFSVKIDQPIAAIPLQIFNYSISPYPEWHSIGFAASFLLVIFILSVNIIIKAITHRMSYYRR